MKLSKSVYLCIGQEFNAAALSMCRAMIFSPSIARHYLAFGAPPEKLRDELLGLPTGCSEECQVRMPFGLRRSACSDTAG